jgi:hypothetical protein
MPTIYENAKKINSNERTDHFFFIAILYSTINENFEACVMAFYCR